MKAIKTLLAKEDEIVQHLTSQPHKLLHLTNAQVFTIEAWMTKEEKTDQKVCRASLRQLISDFLTAAEIAHREGSLLEFCQTLVKGMKILKPQMNNAINCVVKGNFEKIMERGLHSIKNRKDLPNEEKIKFILERYEGAPCIKNTQYAPRGRVTTEGVTAYLAQFESQPTITPSV